MKQKNKILTETITEKFIFNIKIILFFIYNIADQDFLKKQQDVIYLLENIAGTLPYQPYYEIGTNYEFDKHYDDYYNPSVVKYYYGLYKTGHVQPKYTPYSYSVSQLRKEVALLTEIFLGAKDYQTFLYSAAWARVYVNQDQFVTVSLWINLLT